MAANLIKKASQELRRINDSKKMEKVKDTFKSAEMQTATGAVGGAVLAALNDKKFGDDNEVSKIKSIPVNLVGGGIVFVGAMALKKMPGRNLIGGAGLGAALAGLYRVVYDNVDFDKDNAPDAA